MTLRLIHTSDWHLGALLENVPRDREHALFLGWLLEQLREQEAELLVVAGDVFHHSQPSAEAQRAYYRFLARAATLPALRQMVVVAGNHDSAARLEAARPVLEALEVHVVGSWRADDPERCLCTVPAGDTGAAAVVAAVPFIHEFRLGVRTVGAAPSEIAEQLREAFTDVYRSLADRARERAPEAPLLAVGHLTCTGARDGDFTTELHQVGSIGGLSAEIFDERFDYVALGHIHRMFPVQGRRVWYSGSPVPLSLPEAASRRQVLRVDLGEPGEAPEVKPLEVPRSRELFEVRGELEEVTARLREVPEPVHRELPTLAFVELEVERYEPSASQRLREALEGMDEARRPRLVRIAQRQKDAGAREAASLPQETLRELTPRQVFQRLYRARSGGLEAPRELLSAFDSVVSSLNEDGERGEASEAQTP